MWNLSIFCRRWKGKLLNLSFLLQLSENNTKRPIRYRLLSRPYFHWNIFLSASTWESDLRSAAAPVSVSVCAHSQEGSSGPRNPQVSISERQEVAVSQGKVKEEEDEGQQLHKYWRPPLLPISHLCCGDADTWSDLMSPWEADSLKQRRVGAGPMGRTSKGRVSWRDEQNREAAKQTRKNYPETNQKHNNPAHLLFLLNVSMFYYIPTMISRCFTGNMNVAGLRGLLENINKQTASWRTRVSRVRR